MFTITCLGVQVTLAARYTVPVLFVHLVVPEKSSEPSITTAPVPGTVLKGVHEGALRSTLDSRT